jgi:hypothetical protein
MARTRTLALAALVLAFGVAAEWASWDPDEIRFGLTDLGVGCVLVACGAIASLRRPDSRVGG